jgi:hypothetical protein
MGVLSTTWTDEMLAAEAAKYFTRGEFAKGHNSAYQIANNRGLLDAVCAHMEDGSPSDNDAIYIWRANGIQHHGRNVYKIGVTSARLGDQRIVKVAKSSGFSPKVLRLAKVTEKARFIESKLLEMGQAPGFTGFDGCTEFRALTDDEVDFIVEMIDMFSDDAQESFDMPPATIAPNTTTTAAA